MLLLSSQYIGQTGCRLKTNFTEHCRYIKTNDPKSAYALHVLNNRHEYAPIQNSMELIKICKKGWRMNTTENFYIQVFHQQGLLINELYQGEETPLFRIFTPPATPNTHAPSLTKLYKDPP